MKEKRLYNLNWYDHVPENWKIERLKSIFSEIDERSEDGSEELLSVSHYTGVTKKRDSLENEDDFITNAKTLVGYKKVKENDLVSNIMLAWNGSLGISKYEGITSPAYCVYRLKENDNPLYFGYLFSTEIMKAEFRKKSFGIIDSRLRLYSDKFFSIDCPKPDKNVQDNIVEYIDTQKEKITHFIQKKEGFIELLKEQRQGIINKAVTKGLDVNVPLKDSGIDYIGQIPEHWEIKRLKYCGHIKYGLGQPPKYLENGLPLIRATNVERGKINEKDLIRVDPQDVPYERDPVLRTNDIIVVRSGAYTADSAIIPPKYDGAITGYDMVFRSADSNLSEFISFALLSNYLLTSQLIPESQRAAQPHLNREELGNSIVVLPRSKTEIRNITSFIKKEIGKIDQAISKAEREIELIKEYKEAMIAEAVLGKLEIPTI